MPEQLPTVWIPRVLYTAILEEALRKVPCETGGVLIGYWGKEREIVLTALVGPGTNALHRKTSFVPDNAFHTQEIAHHYQASNRTEVYLGDWHTHPNSDAYLSPQDQQTLRKIAEYKAARLATPLMMVLGTKPLELRVWMYQPGKPSFFKRGTQIKECTIEWY